MIEIEAKKFELWLDESGEFENDQNIKKNPSLVGGILVEKNSLNISRISEILVLENVHSNEIKGPKFGDYSVQVLTKTTQNGGSIVIFENEERLKIVDSTTTYLNIISEGIIQLLQLLAAEHGKIELNILVAVRLDMELQNVIQGYIIPHKDYVSRLEEKIIVGLARRLFSNDAQWEWHIELASARTDKRLMLAGVCQISCRI